MEVIPAGQSFGCLGTWVAQGWVFLDVLVGCFLCLLHGMSVDHERDHVCSHEIVGYVTSTHTAWPSCFVPACRLVSLSTVSTFVCCMGKPIL